MDANQFWAERFRVLDPQRALDVRELAQLYVEPPDSPSRRIAQKMDIWRMHAASGAAAAPPKFLFCGARGSGKSTQLRQLAATLTARFEVIFLDVAPALPEQTGTLHLLALFGLALVARLGEWEGQDGGVARVLAGNDAAGGYVAALRRIAGEVEIEPLVTAVGALMTSMGLTLPAAVAPAASLLGSFGKLKEAIRPARSLGLGALGRRVAAELAEDAQDLVLHTNRLAEVLHGRSHKPVLLLVDGLDRFTQLDGVLSALADIELVRDLSCGLVLTGPVNLRHDPHFAGLRQELAVMVHFNLPVVSSNGEPNPAGLALVEDVFVRRAGAHATALAAPEAVRLAAMWSAGMPREFLRILQDAAMQAGARGSTRIELSDVKEAGRELRLVLQQTLTTSDVLLLDRILRGGQITGADREPFLLYENYVVCYPNGDAWFRPHELIVEWVERQATRHRADTPG